jgi:nicotinamidase-related amidase
VGTTPHNGVLFTAVAAAFRGFNRGVPVDAMSGNNANEHQAAVYILANSIVYKVTLTSIDMIKF